jgi:DNA-binding NarL/FixJ family response regulator
MSPARRLESIRLSAYLSSAVPALARGDAERLLRFVAEAESFGGDHPFEGEFLTQLGRLVPADCVGYNDCDGRCGDVRNRHFVRPGDEGLFRGVDWVAIRPVIEAEDPINLHWRQGSYGAAKVSDFLTRRQWHRTRSYQIVLKPDGLDDVLAVRLRNSPPERRKTFVFDRGRWDFSARHRAVLDLLHPHLVQLYRASESRRRLGQALAFHESTRVAVVLLEHGDRISFATTAARELLDRYFAGNGARLPDTVASWLRARRRTVTGEPLGVDAGDRSLVVDVVDDALLLEERQSVPRLTAREREILALVDEGRTNAEIAERLWVSLGTVKKHLDNIYAKLGVHTRTAATALVRERRLDSLER